MRLTVPLTAMTPPLTKQTSSQKDPAPPGEDDQHEERLDEAFATRGVPLDEADDFPLIEEACKRTLIHEHPLRFTAEVFHEAGTAADGRRRAAAKAHALRGGEDRRDAAIARLDVAADGLHEARGAVSRREAGEGVETRQPAQAARGEHALVDRVAREVLVGAFAREHDRHVFARGTRELEQ